MVKWSFYHNVDIYYILFLASHKLWLLLLQIIWFLRNKKREECQGSISELLKIETEKFAILECAMVAQCWKINICVVFSGMEFLYCNCKISLIFRHVSEKNEAFVPHSVHGKLIDLTLQHMSFWEDGLQVDSEWFMFCIGLCLSLKCWCLHTLNLPTDP